MHKPNIKCGEFLDLRYNVNMKDFKAEYRDQGTTSFISIIQIEEACVLKLDGSEYQALVDDVIITKGKQSYSSDAPLLIYHLNEDFFDNLFESQISDCLIFFDMLHTSKDKKDHLYFSHIDSETQSLLQTLRSEANQDDIYHEKVIRLLLVGIFSYLDRSRHTTLIIPRSTMLKDHVFGKVLKYMGDHYRDITLESCAKQFGYHPDYFSYRFKKITGESFSKKLLSIKMEEAMHLLITSELTIQQISEASGYQDRSHFSRNFHTYTGMSPKQYRLAHQKEG